MQKSKIRDIDRGWLNIKNEVAKAKDAVVRIGVLQDAGMAMERNEDGTIMESETTLAEVAYYNEFGTSRGIPERPFIRSAHDENRDVYTKRAKKEFTAVFAGRTSVRNALERLGALAQGHVRKKIKTLKSPANAASTVKQKGSTNPLIDTGHMLKSIDYEVRL